MKDIKVIKPLEDFFFIGTTENIIYQKIGFLGSSMGVDLPLIKYVLTPLECFAAIKGNSSCVSNRCSYSKKKKKKKMDWGLLRCKSQTREWKIW